MSLLPLIDQHGLLTEDLAGLLQEKASVDAAIITTRAATFTDLLYQGQAITTIKEQVSASVAHFASESVKLSGQIEALRVQLHHLDQRLQYGDRIVT
jgi:hypothetical protein